jgi:uncharacterized RDD family membrane protein YckC
MTSPAPGWYPDPHVPTQMRWWDGSSWTDDTYERTIPLDAGPAPSARTGQPAQSTAGGTAWTSQSGGTAVAARTEDGVPLAAWGWRALARTVDAILVNVLALVLAFPATADVFRVFSEQVSASLQSAQSSAGDAGSWVTDPRLVKAFGVITLVEIVVSLVYEMGFLLWRQATPGKLMVGLRVRPWQPGARLAPNVVARRWLASEGASSIPNIGLLYYVFDVLWPLRDPRRQALHDKFAGTCVVRSR